MKKTIIALFALASVSMGASLKDGTLMTGSSITLNTEEWTLPGASVTMLLNVEAFSEAIDTATNSARPVFVSMTDGTYTAGLAACEIEEKSIVGAWGKTAGETYNNLYTMDALDGYSSLTQTNIIWENVTAAALTFTENMSYSSASATYYLTVLMSDNTYETYAASTTGLKVAASGDITKINIDPDIVSKAYVYDGVLNAEDSIAINTSLIVPEPTTATLSLLALAGLAVRRRRK